MIQTKIAKLNGTSDLKKDNNEVLYYSGIVYKNWNIDTSNTKVLWTQKIISDFKNNIQSVISSGKISFSEDYWIENYNTGITNINKENLVYHRYYASEWGKNPLKWVNAEKNANTTIFQVIETYANWNKLYICTKDWQNWKLIVRWGKINGTNFGSSYHWLDELLMAWKKPDEKAYKLVNMYIPDEIKQNLNNQTNNTISSVLYYSWYTYKLWNIDGKWAEIIVKAYVWREWEIEQIKKEVTNFYSSSFASDSVFWNSNEIDKNLVAYTRYYASNDWKNELISVNVMINKDWSITTTENYNKNKLSIMSNSSFWDNWVRSWQINWVVFWNLAREAYSASNTKETKDFNYKNINFYHPY